MRNSHRSRRGSRLDDERNVAGVGELRAVAERLLETGAQYLEQGREWLHAATRKERDGGHHGPGHRASQEGFGPPREGFRDKDDDFGPYAPDETAFSSTGGHYDARARAGYDYDDHRARDFDDHADRLARGRGGPQRGGRRDDPFEAWAETYLPGSYGFGGEGRSQTGAPSGSGRTRHERGFDEVAGRWERAYRAQGHGGHRGRGPRGYTRSDERILDEVNERLCDDPIVDATDVEVRCERGCIVLEGRVPTRWMKHRAEDIADAVSGVKDVDNRIRVSAEEPVAQGDFDTGRARSGATYSPDGRPGSKSYSTGAGSSAGASTDQEAKATSAPSSGSTATGAGTGAGPAQASSSSMSPQEPQSPH